MKVIKYNLQGADDEGVKEHPQTHVESLGMKILAFEGCPIADCVFMEVEDVPATLPSYIELSNYELVK